MGNVGQVSNRHDFLGEFLIILSTASLETCVKAVMFGGLKEDDHYFHCQKGTKDL